MTKDVGYIRRTINEMRLPHVLLAALRGSPLWDVRWDGVVWYSPTIFLAPIVRVLRRKHKCRSYLILRDIFPEWAVDMGLMTKGLSYRFFKFIEHSQYAVADTIGVQCAANLPYMKEWSQSPGRRIEVLQNWLADAEDTGCRIHIGATKLAGRRIFAYVGNMGVAQGLDAFVDLAVRMRDRRDIGFLFVGRGSDASRLAARAASHELDNTLFHDEIEPEEIPGLLAQCHVGMLALDPRHRTHNIPGKFLTYMQAGLSVLARVNPGNDLEVLIKDNRVGRVCTDGDVALLERFVEELIASPEELAATRERARSISKRLFSSKAAAEQIVRALLSQAA